MLILPVKRAGGTIGHNILDASKMLHPINVLCICVHTALGVSGWKMIIQQTYGY